MKITSVPFRTCNFSNGFLESVSFQEYLYRNKFAFCFVEILLYRCMFKNSLVSVLILTYNGNVLFHICSFSCGQIQKAESTNVTKFANVNISNQNMISPIVKRFIVMKSEIARPVKSHMVRVLFLSFLVVNFQNTKEIRLL